MERRSTFSSGAVSATCLLAAMLALTVAAFANIGVITKVLEGDLVQVGDSFRARLTGIRVPLRNEPLGYEIYDFTKRQLEGRTVRIITWTTDNTAAGIVYDEDGYARVQIFYGRLSGEKGGGESFNEVMLKKGYARVDPKYLPDELKHYFELEKEARAKGLGIWKTHPEAGTGD